MKTMMSQNLVQQADLLVKNAKAELMRAEEDIVTHAICKDVRQAINHYLTSFLLKNGVAIEGPITIEYLLDACVRIDDRFSYLDTSPINCRMEIENDQFCLEAEKVTDCFSVAEHTRAIAITNAPSY